MNIILARKKWVKAIMLNSVRRQIFAVPADFGVQIVPFRVSHMVAAGNGQMMSCAREFLHFFLPKHGRSGNKRKSNGFEMGAPGIGISCGNKPSSLSVLLN